MTHAVPPRSVVVRLIGRAVAKGSAAPVGSDRSDRAAEAWVAGIAVVSTVVAGPRIAVFRSTAVAACSSGTHQARDMAGNRMDTRRDIRSNSRSAATTC